jgi:hypothetical protein
MPAADAARLLLFADSPRSAGAGDVARVRRYRLARLRLDEARREESEPRYAYLKRSYD